MSLRLFAGAAAGLVSSVVVLLPLLMMGALLPGSMSCVEATSSEDALTGAAGEEAGLIEGLHENVNVKYTSRLGRSWLSVLVELVLSLR